MAGRRRRFGALRKLQSGRWQARYRAPDGREITAPRTFATKTDAAVFLDAIEVDLRRGVWHDPGPAQRETVRNWSTRWLVQHSAALTVSTAVSYRGLLDCCVLDREVEGRQIGLGDLPLAALTPMRVGEWLADLQRSGLSASRVRKAYRVLSLAMDAAVRDRLLQVSPCGRHHRLPRLPEHEPQILTVAQVEALAAHLRNGSPARGKDRSSCQPIKPNPSLALLVELMAYCGLRVGEALALRRRHVDVLGCRLVVAESLIEADGQFTFGSTKTHQVREVPLPRSLLADVERHLDDVVEKRTDALLFPGRTGNPMRYRNLRRSFDAACGRIGLVGVTPHSLRASCASWVAETDGVLEAARRLGHSRSSITTRHYARPMAGGDTTVADRLDLARQAARAGSSDPIWHANGTTAQTGTEGEGKGGSRKRPTSTNANTGR
jgi:integrase